MYVFLKIGKHFEGFQISRHRVKVFWFLLRYRRSFIAFCVCEYEFDLR